MLRSLSIPARGTALIALGLLVLGASVLAGCSPQGESDPAANQAGAGLTAYFDATIIDGTGGPPITEGVLLVRDGRIERVGSADEIDVPEGAILVDLGPSSSTYSEVLDHKDALVTSCFLSPEQAGSIDHPARQGTL